MGEEAKKNSTKGSWFLFLFALPFAAVGVVMLYFTLSAVWSWYVMRSWERVPAVILQVHLEEHRGDDSTSYKATAKYAYVYKGKNYRGDRVGTASGSGRRFSAEMERPACCLMSR